ncbi:MAG: glycosyltransferase family 9 protein, partial [Cephaloticoccus sp.]
WLAGALQRFGLVRPDKRRPLLTHGFHVPGDFDETRHHQLELWTHFLTHFGLEASPDLSPLASPPRGDGLVVGLIAGSENNPEKRWPVAHWCDLIGRLPANAKVVLFGTATDRAITDEISARCGRSVDNLAGRTNLREYCEALQRCTVLVTNDTGGMHLANALGVPLVALFGPTNPVRTRPVFEAPVTILQPPGCPETGGGALVELLPDQVAAALVPHLQQAV